MAGQQHAVSEAVRRAVLVQYAAHKSWSVKLHHDNIVALAEAQLNDIEIVWGDLKAHHLAHQTFVDVDALHRAIHQAVAALNPERMALPLAEQRISA